MDTDYKNIDTKIAIHVGLHKTGTTWLQRRFFNEYFGFNPVMDHNEVWKYIVNPHDFIFNKEAAIHYIKEKIDVNCELVPVISSEILSGHPFYGARMSAQYAQRIKGLFPEALIIITIREQVRMLSSIYMQYILRGGTKKPEQFFDTHGVIGFDHFCLEHFRYHNIVKYYWSLFGQERVIVLSQEEMAGDLSGFLGKILAFTGATPRTKVPVQSNREGRSYPEFASPVLRRINHVRNGPASSEPMIDLGQFGHFMYRAAGRLSRSNWISWFFRSQQPVSEYIIKNFGNCFSDSNRILNEMVGHQTWLESYRM